MRYANLLSLFVLAALSALATPSLIVEDQTVADQCVAYSPWTCQFQQSRYYIECFDDPYSILELKVENHIITESEVLVLPANYYAIMSTDNVRVYMVYIGASQVKSFNGSFNIRDEFSWIGMDGYGWILPDPTYSQKSDDITILYLVTTSFVTSYIRSPDGTWTGTPYSSHGYDINTNAVVQNAVDRTNRFMYEMMGLDTTPIGYVIFVFDLEEGQANLETACDDDSDNPCKHYWDTMEVPNNGLEFINMAYIPGTGRGMLAFGYLSAIFLYDIQPNNELIYIDIVVTTGYIFQMAVESSTLVYPQLYSFGIVYTGGFLAERRSLVQGYFPQSSVSHALTSNYNFGMVFSSFREIITGENDFEALYYLFQKIGPGFTSPRKLLVRESCDTMNCTNCASADKPYCYWCVGEGACKMAGESCTGEVYVESYKQNDTDCPIVETFAPQKIAAGSAGIVIDMTGIFYGDSMSIDCNFGGQTVGAIVYDNTSLSCATPGNLQFSGNYSLYAEHSGNSVTPGIELVVRNCSSIALCKDCLEYTGCFWNLALGECSNNSAAPFTLDVAECPAITGLSWNSKLIGSSTTNITIFGNNFVETVYSCEWTNSSSEWYTNGYYLDKNSILCEELNYTGSEDVEFDVKVRVVIVNDYSESTLPFYFYRCNNSLECNECLHGDNFTKDCEWCASAAFCNQSTAGCESGFSLTTCSDIVSVDPPNEHYLGDETGYLIFNAIKDGTKNYTVLLNDTTSLSTTVVNSTHLMFRFPVFNGTGNISVVVLYGNVTYAELATSYEIYTCELKTATTCYACEAFGATHSSCGYCFSDSGEYPNECLTEGECNADKYIRHCPFINKIVPDDGHRDYNTSIVVDGSYFQNITFDFNIVQESIPQTGSCLYASESTLQCVLPPSILNHVGDASLNITFNGTKVESASELEFEYWVCSSFQNCGDCMAYSFCSWCLFTGCMEIADYNTSCNATESLQVTTCPEILSLDPPYSYYTGGGDLKVTLTTDIPIPSQYINSTTHFDCSFDGEKTNATIKSESEIVCEGIPAHAFSGGNMYENVMLVIAEAAAPYREFVAKEYEYVVCRTSAMDCEKCIERPTTSDKCGWCVSDSGGFSCGIQEWCSTAFLTSCANITAATPSYGAKEGGTDVVLAVNNIPVVYNGSYYCQFKNSLQLSDAIILNDSHVLCVSPANPLNFGIDIVFSEQIGVLLDIYDMTTNTVPYEYLDCAQNSAAGSCSICTGKSEKRCGWCPMYVDTCTTQAKCPQGDLIWYNEDNVCPNIASVDPVIGSSNGATTIVVHGSSFFNSSQFECSFGGVRTAALYLNGTTISCNVPFRPMTLQVETVDLYILWDGNVFIPSSFPFTYQKSAEDGGIPPELFILGGVSVGFLALLLVLVVVVVVLVILILMFLLVGIKLKKGSTNKQPKMTKPSAYDTLFKKDDVSKYEVLDKERERLLSYLQDIIVDTALDDDSLLFHMISTLKPEELDEFARSAVYLISSVSVTRMAQFISMQIQAEIANSNESKTLFRANSISTKLFSSFCRLTCMDFFFEALGPLLNEIDNKFVEKTDGDSVEMNVLNASMELDETRIGDMDPAFLSANMYQLMLTITNILRMLRNMNDKVPLHISHILFELKSALELKFPDFVSIGIGSFYFLRMICPSLVAPNVYGAMDHPPNPKAMRMLILISKTLQNISNEALPGAKEQYMQKIGGFIKENIPNAHDILLDVAKRRSNAGNEVLQHEAEDVFVPHKIVVNSQIFFYNLMLRNWEEYSISSPELKNVYRDNPQPIARDSKRR